MSIIEMTDAEIEKILVGRWRSSEYQNQGWIWSYDCEFTADGHCKNEGTGKRDGQSMPFANRGRWWVKDKQLYYKVEEASIPGLVGREIVDPLLSVEPDRTVWRNSQGGEVSLHRIAG